MQSHPASPRITEAHAKSHAEISIIFSPGLRVLCCLKGQVYGSPAFPSTPSPGRTHPLQPEVLA